MTHPATDPSCYCQHHKVFEKLLLAHLEPIIDKNCYLLNSLVSGKTEAAAIKYWLSPNKSKTISRVRKNQVQYFLTCLKPMIPHGKMAYYSKLSKIIKCKNTLKLIEEIL